MKRLVLLGIAIFLAVLVATFPARVAYNWFAPADIRLSGIAGSVWAGSAAEVSAGGAYIRNLSWRFMPASLLSGRLGFRTHSNPAAGTLTADIGLSADGELLLSGVTGHLPLDLLHPAMQQSGIRGDVWLQFESVVIKNGMPIAAEGSVTVSDFFVPDLSSSTIGDFRADFRTSDDSVLGSVEDVSAVLDVAGTISLNHGGVYTFIGQVAATPETPPSIVNQLRFLGSANEQGQHEFRFEGQL